MVYPHFKNKFPYIFVIDEARDFKFGRRMGLVHHKIAPRRKSGRGPGLGELPKILESPLIFLQRLQSVFKFGMQLGFAKAHHKIPPRKSRLGPLLGDLSKILGVPLQYFYNG